MLRTYLSLVPILLFDEITVAEYIDNHCPSEVCNRKRTPKFDSQYCIGNCVECWNKTIE